MHASTSSDYPDLYWDADAPPNAIFGVSAPHHLPGMQGAAARATLTRNHQIGGDLPGFPNWSRTWYGGHMSADGHAYTTVPPGPSASGWEAETLGSGSGHGAPRMPYGRHYGPAGGVDDYVKEERMRMLAKEFGPKVKRKGEKDDDSDNEENDEEDEDANLPSGSITKAGKIVHSWPRLFSATRALQVILSLLTMLVGIGSALLIKPGKDKPPPQGTLPSFVLYGVTVLSTLVMLYLFVFRPCCCDPQKRMSKAGPGSMMLGGGMVIPVLGGGPHGKKSKNPFAGKKNKKMGAGTTVNLIVDPAMMGGRGGGADDDSDDDSCSDEENESSADAARKARRRRRRRNKRNKVLNMRLQARWVVERKFLKVLLAWDIILMLLWIAADVMTIFVGKKCPSGSSNGWCDWYNGAIACSCISTVVFLLAIWWDISDLRASSKGPRPGFPAGV
ncbi:hypothetical protein K437DRAFT_221804 [Tilletiaria anomala UBC 951]|uniref:MARVEL domain-containing protein n=1 Tax=Tilletiaria anomala (strain ATCC 24038 / CBS 436.72 / UBC 951) TaxID=1037660 RepID=A0A066WAW5_TILAU|nr:uncharacterized protein K437DRAFT_221804 [Tilletiaria anomala UBC 951]KDN50841.1 hypothetical protein K437DRAFT_221804 [Tilletiaria anomala UBC 951]